MARTVRDTKLETRAARERLAARAKPYWRAIEAGLHVGYRKNKTGGGAWIARRFAESRYRETRLGVADDLTDADGIAVMAFAQAQEAARRWWIDEGRKSAGHAPARVFTVNDALDAYFAERERRGAKGIGPDRCYADARIRPTLGRFEVAKLTPSKIEDWRDGLVDAAKLRGRRDVEGEDAKRARRVSANRVMSILRAALNLAWRKGRVPTDDAWRRVAPFRQVAVAVVRYLDEAEQQRLANACHGAFRNLVRGALLTGMRYGELCRLAAGDFNMMAGVVTVCIAKSGKPRHVVLTDEGRDFFEIMTANKTGQALIFTDDDDESWNASDQHYRMASACKRASIEPAVSFHVLRHSHASTLAMKGVPMAVIAAQLGHSDSKITERHYAHLAPNYVADTIRAAMPNSGIVEPSNVKPMRQRKA